VGWHALAAAGDLKMRLFFALELDEPTRRALGKALERLGSAAPRVRWVRPENLHVTVKFLGEVPETDLAEVCAAADRAAAKAAPFSLAVAGLGAFPAPDRPRVVWAGCSEGTEPARALADQVEAQTVPLGFAAERRAYTPHVTLGRVRRPRDRGGLPAALGRAPAEYGCVAVEALTVFESELSRGGPVYTALHHARLSA